MTVSPFPYRASEAQGKKPIGVLTLREITWLAIQDAIERNDGNCSKAARELGIGRTKIYRWIKEMNRGPFKDTP